jgi:UDP-2,3-diacylglucosamine pyrophosphatase LpxH
MPRDAIFILSDLHFNANSPDRQRNILRFLRDVVRRRARQLVLNGDIIDYVRGDQPPQSGTFRELQRALDQLLAEGIPVTYIVGNHDLPLITLLRPSDALGPEDLYADRSSLEIVPGLTLAYRVCTLEYQGRRVHIEHGHVYDPGWLMTPEQQQSLYRAHSPVAEGEDWMGRLLRLFEEAGQFGEDDQGRLVRTGSSLPPIDMARYAVHMLERQKPADWYILGHFHAPTLETLEEGRKYANSGDSLGNGGYAVLTEGQLRLGDWREVLA